MQLESWKAGKLCSWKVGKLGSCAVGKLENCEVGMFESWEVGKLGSWNVGNWKLESQVPKVGKCLWVLLLLKKPGCLQENSINLQGRMVAA